LSFCSTLSADPVVPEQPRILHQIDGVVVDLSGDAARRDQERLPSRGGDANRGKLLDGRGLRVVAVAVEDLELHALPVEEGVHEDLLKLFGEQDVDQRHRRVTHGTSTTIFPTLFLDSMKRCASGSSSKP